MSSPRMSSRLWPMWLGGALLGMGAAGFALLLHRPIGAFGPLRSLITWVESTIGGSTLLRTGISPDIGFGLVAVGMILGAAASSIVTGTWRFRKAPFSVILKGFVGGVIIAAGASFMKGCTVFHVLGGVPSLCFGSILALLSIALGVYVATMQMRGFRR